MRTRTISHIRPLTRRGTDLVVGWVFRLTLIESGVTAFDDIRVWTGASVARPLKEWRRGELDTLLNEESKLRPAPKGHPSVTQLHERLDDRLAVEERPELDPESLAP